MPQRQVRELLEHDRNRPVNLLYPGHRIGKATKAAEGFFLIVLTVLGFAASLPIHPSSAPPNSTSNPVNPTNVQGLQSPQFAGANPVPDLSMPKTVVSSIDNLIGAGGLIQTSPSNWTLYNSGISIRLLGGALPHDQLLGVGVTIASQYLFWGVLASVSSISLPLRPLTSNLTSLGTNSSGTFVLRTMQVSSGVYSGVFKVVYRATSTGALEWDLSFVPNTSAQYSVGLA